MSTGNGATGAAGPAAPGTRAVPHAWNTAAGRATVRNSVAAGRTAEGMTRHSQQIPTSPNQDPKGVIWAAGTRGPVQLFPARGLAGARWGPARGYRPVRRTIAAIPRLNRPLRLPAPSRRIRMYGRNSTTGRASPTVGKRLPARGDRKST